MASCHPLLMGLFGMDDWVFVVVLVSLLFSKSPVVLGPVSSSSECDDISIVALVLFFRASTNYKGGHDDEGHGNKKN